MLLISDIDGPLLIDRTPEFIDWANSQPEVKIPWSYPLLLETGDWDIATGNIPPVRTHALFDRFSRSEACPVMQATPGAANVLRTVSSSSKYIATSRAGAMQDITMSFLEKLCGSFFGSSFQARLQEKAELSRELEAKFFIDDDPNVLRKIRQISPKTQPILFPARVKRRLTELDGITVLEAEACVTEAGEFDQYLAICSLAWREISTILQNSSSKH